MSHVAPWQLQSRNYPFSYQMETRFQDMDTLGHINNVAMASLFESSRVRFNAGIDHHWERPGRRALIAALTINYLAESYYPEPITVCCGISRCGNSSWQVAQAAFQQARAPLGSTDTEQAEQTMNCVAAGVATLVLVNEAGSMTLPNSFAQALAELSVDGADA